MGVLVAMKYSTGLAAHLADHTYVQCQTGGKGWGCHGGKTGGSAFAAGPGSTRRADTIAGPKETAGITCYGINGVCHQAANRILHPAQVTVRKARGYWVSESMFGTYGRPSGFLGWCRAPLQLHQHIDDDLPACSEPPAGFTHRASESLGRVRGEDDPDARKYARAMVREYRTGMKTEVWRDENAFIRFQTDRFSDMVRHRMGWSPNSRRGQILREVRERVELERREVERAYLDRLVEPRRFADRLDALTREFQDDVADAMSPQQYERLFGLSVDVRITLIDRTILG